MDQDKMEVDEDSKPSEVEKVLQKTISTLGMLSVFVSKFDGDSKGEKEYFRLLETFPKLMHRLKMIPKKEYNMDMSMEILKCVDEGFSPEVFLNYMNETVENRLDETKGKIEGFELLQKNIEAELEKWEDGEKK